MKIKKIIQFMSITLVQGVFSQTITVTYTEKKDIPQEKLAQLPPQVVQLLTKEINCKLVNSQGISVFKFEEQVVGTTDMNIFIPKRESYYKQLITNKLTTLAYLDDEGYIVSDALPKIEWKIENNIQKIGMYECQKATSYYNGAQIVAWFTKDIAITDGPLMLNGLPGLIIKVSLNNMVTYSAEKIVVDKNNSTLLNFTSGKSITSEEFEKLKAKLAEETLVKQKEAGALHIEVK